MRLRIIGLALTLLLSAGCFSTLRAQTCATSTCSDRATNQVRIPGHQADRLTARWEMVFHILFLEDVAARVQEIRVVLLPNQFLEF